MKKCPRLAHLRLVTSPGDGPAAEQEQAAKLRELAGSLGRHNVQLAVMYSTTLHDREIRLDSGWIVKIGRGLDIFRPPEGKMVIGYFEMEHRRCLETTVDIFFKKIR